MNSTFNESNSIEVFSYLRDINNIEGIDIEDLKELFNNKSTRYSVKSVNNGAILIYDADNNKSKLIKCCNSYFKFNTSNCDDIRDILNTTTHNCSECFLNAIDKHESNNLVKK